MVQVGLEYRYMPPVAKLIEIVNGGSLGHVRMVSIREHRFPFLVKVGFYIEITLRVLVLILNKAERVILAIGERLESVQC